MTQNATETKQPDARGDSRLKAFVSRAARNPRWMIMDSLSRFVLVRDAVKSLQVKPAIERYNPGASGFRNIDADEFVAALKRDGFCPGLVLPENVTKELLSFAASGYCYGDADPRCGFRYANKAEAQIAVKRVFSQATYFFADAVQPAVDLLANDPLLLAIAAKYLGATPVTTGNRLWWTFAASEAEFNSSITTSFFHYDKDDYACVRLFFYLTTVDAEHGPHVVVRGSHIRKKLSQIISLGERSDVDILNYYGQENLVTIYGEPGFGFAEDPFCFHKATRPRAGDRLMLELKYATRDYHIFPPPDRAAIANILD